MLAAFACVPDDRQMLAVHRHVVAHGGVVGECEVEHDLKGVVMNGGVVGTGWLWGEVGGGGDLCAVDAHEIGGGAGAGAVGAASRVTRMRHMPLVVTHMHRMSHTCIKHQTWLHLLV